MIKFAYFETASNDALMVPLSSYLGMEPINDVSCTLHFAKVDNALDTTKVVINFTTGMTTEAFDIIHKAFCANLNDGLIVMGDDNDTNCTPLEHITGAGASTL